MSHRSPRAFVLLMILLLLAMVSAVAITTLDAAQHVQVSQSRQEFQVKARGIAERCSGLVNAWLDEKSVLANFADNVLDTGSTNNTSDTDFLPPTNLGPTGAVISGVKVQVPANTTDDKHHYRKYNIDDGACYIRIDDNNDDGSAADDPDHDTDKGVIVTVIGIMPRSGSDSEQYAKAFARSTIRRFRSYATGSGTATTGGGGLYSGGKVDFKNGLSMCGSALGGVAADTLELGGTSCTCGPIDAGIAADPTNCTCTPACAAQGTPDRTIYSRPDPVVNMPIPAGDSFLHNEGFGPLQYDFGVSPSPGAPNRYTTNPLNPTLSPTTDAYVPVAQNIGAAPSATSPCKIYFQHGLATPYIADTDANVYVWDRSDTNASQTLDSSTGGSLVVKQGTTDVTGTTEPSQDPITNDKCNAYSSTTVDKPCSWTLSAGKPTAVTCAANETPCWKLVATLDATAANIYDGSSAAEDFDSKRTGNQREQQSADRAFRASMDTLPYMVDVAGAPPTWANVCGNPASIATPLASGVSVGGAGNSFTINAITLANFPYPTVMVFEVGATTNGVVVAMGASGESKFTLLTDGYVTSTSGEQWCPNCQTNDSTATTVWPPTCSADNAVAQAVKLHGRAIKANGQCTGAGLVVGERKCAGFNGLTASCVLGNLVATEAIGSMTPAASSCDPGITGVCDGASSKASICQADLDMIGCIYSRASVCFKNGPKVFGKVDSVDTRELCGIYSQKDIGFKNNAYFKGQMVAQEDAGAKNNASIDYDGGGNPVGVSIPNTATGSASALWMESTW